MRIKVLQIFYRPIHTDYKNYHNSIPRYFLGQEMLTKIKVDIVIKVVNIDDPLCGYCGCGLSSLGCDNPF